MTERDESADEEQELLTVTLKEKARNGAARASETTKKASKQLASVIGDWSQTAVTVGNKKTKQANATARDGLSSSWQTVREFEWVTAAQTLVLGIVFLPLAVLSMFLSVLPPSWRVFHKIHRWSAWWMQKASNADTLANVRRSNGHEDVLPAAWVEGAEDDKDSTGWKIKGIEGKRYDRAVHGRSTTRLGKANLIHVNEDDTEQGTWAEAAIDNALQLNREKYLFRDATLLASNATLINSDGDDSRALADGGQQVGQRPVKVQDISIDRPGICQDILVPLGSRDGYDGQVISWSQYRNLKKDQSDQDTVRDAKNQAWAAAKLDEIEAKDLLKWVLMIGAWSAILLFHQEIGAFIAGLSGGGGGGAVGGALGLLVPVSFRGGI